MMPPHQTAVVDCRWTFASGAVYNSKRLNILHQDDDRMQKPAGPGSAIAEQVCLRVEQRALRRRGSPAAVTSRSRSSGVSVVAVAGRRHRGR